MRPLLEDQYRRMLSHVCTSANPARTRARVTGLVTRRGPGGMGPPTPFPPRGTTTPRPQSGNGPPGDRDGVSGGQTHPPTPPPAPPPPPARGAREMAAQPLRAR